MKDFKTFIIRLLILILTPILVIGGFAAYTHLSNARPQSGLLQYSVAPQIVFTGEPTSYTISFLGHKAPRPEGKPPPPVDMIFVVDVSGSMSDSLSDMVHAARTVAHELTTTKTHGQIRFALTVFDSNNNIKTTLNDDINSFYAELNNLTIDGGSNISTAFAPINQLLSQARPHAAKTVVFYTDGYVFYPDKIDDIIRDAEALRNQGIQIFSVSPPQDDASNMSLITGDPSRILRPHNLQDIVNRFRYVADALVGLYGDRAQLFHPLDGRNFLTPPEDSEWHRDDTGNLHRNVDYLPFRSVDYSHTLIPQTIGQWTVGLAPPTMTFITPQNQVETMNGERRPQLLVLNIWLLILAFLPALLWLLAYLLRHKPPELVPAYIPPPIRSLAQPTPLPLPSHAYLKRKTVVPTLFIGLGGAGRQALYATQEQLRAAHLEAKNLPYRFLYLDLDASQPVLKGNEENLREIIAPIEIRQTAQYLPPANQILPPHLKWFNPQDYLDASRAELDLSKGAQGRRVLARLALFQWLEKGELLTILKEENQKLLDFPSVDENRQIILFADRNGGVGNAWMIDIARLLRRIARQKQLSTVPDIISILSSAPNPQQQQNRQALDKEIETAQLTGAFPQRVTYQPDDELLDQTDTESPFNWLFSVIERAATQSAALSAVLVERYPRWTLLNNKLHQGQIVSLQAKSIHVMPDLNHQLVKREILLRLLGAEVLLDLELEEASQKLVIKSVPDPEKLLTQWHKACEPKGTPWHLLLNAVIGHTPQFFQVMEEKGHPDLIWFQQAFIASLTQQLRGHRTNGRWMPGQAVIGLRLFAERLAQQVKPQAPPNKLALIITQLIDLANNAANHIEQWLKDFMPLCEEIGKQKHQLIQQRETAQNRDNQLFIDKSINQQRIEQWTEQALHQWVGSQDITSAICERLFFTARLDKNEVIITLAAYVEDRQTFSTAEAAIKRLESYAETAAQQVPTLKVEGALAEIEEPQALARKLIDTQQVAEQTVMVMPTVTEKSVTKVLNDFREAIIDPAGHAPANYSYGDDHSAIRRLALRTEVLPDSSDVLPFVQAAEQIAELARQRAINKFQMDLPTFPPALRIALSQPDAFRSFSRAYKAGYIIKDETDERGITQWVFGDQKEFLTFGHANSLADAAANYVYMMKTPQMDFSERETTGDFSELESWQSVGGAPQNEDVFVLIAMMVED
jgi:hypothetical protein